MYGRPAGLSDEEDTDDDNGFSFPDEVKTVQKYVGYIEEAANCKMEAQANQVYEARVEEERKLQFHVMHACMTGHLATINKYVNLGHDANDFLHTGWTPLLYAASSVRSEVVECLLTLGADPNKHKDGYTPLMALCNSNKGTTAGCLNCLALLIEANANVNASSKQKETALMFACKSRGPEVISELLKHVDDINVTDGDGRTALFYAVLANKPEVLKILVANKAVTECRDRNNHTARDIAISKGYDKVVLLLTSENDIMPDDCAVAEVRGWRDLFPTLCTRNDRYVNGEVANILYGMGMEQYKCAFKGIDLKAFLKLTDVDLLRLGIDVPFQRKIFLEALHRFHLKTWSAQSMGAIKKYLPYTIYDGVISLGNAAKQIGVIGSSFRYIKDSLLRARESGIVLTSKQKSEYNEQLEKTQKTLTSLRKELRYVRSLADKIKKESKLGSPAAYIGPKKKKSNWTIILSITLIAGMYLSRTAYMQKLWNE